MKPLRAVIFLTVDSATTPDQLARYDRAMRTRNWTICNDRRDRHHMTYPPLTNDSRILSDSETAVTRSAWEAGLSLWDAVCIIDDPASGSDQPGRTRGTFDFDY